MSRQNKSKLDEQSNHYKVGKFVRAKRFNQDAVISQVLSHETYQIELLSNGLRLKETIDYLELLPANIQAPQRVPAQSSYPELNVTSAELDLHGMRYEPALTQVAQFLDQAIINQYSYIRINHGKGSGVLQAGVWHLLSVHSQVKHYQFAPQNLGGRGVTIVELK
ncbi:MAG: Smr/MutS family protein [Streptococcaceae bacterium]|nr:Smr/MutS family protein [Streptococcaceae bacterium]MCH4177254.1 Smr/MutS family protein [Streptococcaceae bacterium]